MSINEINNSATLNGGNKLMTLNNTSQFMVLVEVQ